MDPWVLLAWVVAIGAGVGALFLGNRNIRRFHEQLSAQMNARPDRMPTDDQQFERCFATVAKIAAEDLDIFAIKLQPTDHLRKDLGYTYGQMDAWDPLDEFYWLVANETDYSADLFTGCTTLGEMAERIQRVAGKTMAQ